MKKERLSRKIQDVIAWSQIEKERQVDLIEQEADRRLTELRRLCEHEWTKWNECHDEMFIGVVTTWRRHCQTCRLLEIAKEKPDGDIIPSDYIRTLP